LVLLLLLLLLIFSLKLFPFLICFDENANGGWKGSCPLVMALALGLFDLNCFRGGYIDFSATITMQGMIL
jgi:hypothetical protein